MDAVAQYLTHSSWESKFVGAYPATSYAYYVGVWDKLLMYLDKKKSHTW